MPSANTTAITTVHPQTVALNNIRQNCVTIIEAATTPRDIIECLGGFDAVDSTAFVCKLCAAYKFKVAAAREGYKLPRDKGYKDTHKLEDYYNGLTANDETAVGWTSFRTYICDYEKLMRRAADRDGGGGNGLGYGELILACAGKSRHMLRLVNCVHRTPEHLEQELKDIKAAKLKEKEDKAAAERATANARAAAERATAEQARAALNATATPTATPVDDAGGGAVTDDDSTVNAPTATATPTATAEPDDDDASSSDAADSSSAADDDATVELQADLSTEFGDDYTTVRGIPIPNGTHDRLKQLCDALWEDICDDDFNHDCLIKFMATVGKTPAELTELWAKAKTDETVRVTIPTMRPHIRARRRD